MTLHESALHYSVAPQNGAGVVGITLKDIRSKAVSGAKKMGYTEDEIQVEIDSTKGYICAQAVPASTVIMQMPEWLKQDEYSQLRECSSCFSRMKIA